MGMVEADEKLDHLWAPKGAKSVSKDEVEKALEVYHKCKSVTEVVRLWGYPSRQALYGWIQEEGRPPKEKSRYRGNNTPVFQRKWDTAEPAFIHGGGNICRKDYLR
jgi:hypothetical protein